MLRQFYPSHNGMVGMSPNAILEIVVDDDIAYGISGFRPLDIVDRHTVDLLGIFATYLIIVHHDFLICCSSAGFFVHEMVSTQKNGFLICCIVLPSLL